MRNPIYMLLLLYLAIPRLSAASSLRERLASGECGALDEIVFATRTVSEDPHWYANLSYFGRRHTAAADASLHTTSRTVRTA